MRFVNDEWVPGARAAFEKFPGYVPREEQASWLAGGKRMLVDRVEWTVIADPATAAAALQAGQVDWWENPILDLVPLLRKNRNVTVDIADPLGNFGVLRMNHLHPPFNDVRARRAVLMALSQEDFIRLFSATTTVYGSRCLASLRRARRSTPKRAAKSSKVRAISTAPSAC